MATWSHSSLTGFIELYRTEECLWKINLPAYNNRHCKEQAYQRLLRYVHTFDPTATKETVIKKINTIRTTFRREIKKVNSSNLSGAGSDELHYVPKLWYYNELVFLLDKDETGAAYSSLGRHDPPTFSQDTSEDRIPADDLFDSKFEVLDIASTEPTQQTPTTSTPTPEQRQTLKPRPEASTDHRPGQPNINSNKVGGSKRKAEDEMLETERQGWLNPSPMSKEDQFDVFGKLMAHKMRNLPHDQRVLAERLCHDVMLDAELGCLTRQTRLGEYQSSNYRCQAYNNSNSNQSQLLHQHADTEVYRSHHHSHTVLDVKSENHL